MVRYRFKGKSRSSLMISFVICLVVLVIRIIYELSTEETSGDMSSFIGGLAIIWIFLAIVIHIILLIKDSI